MAASRGGSLRRVIAWRSVRHSSTAAWAARTYMAGMIAMRKREKTKNRMTVKA